MDNITLEQEYGNKNYGKKCGEIFICEKDIFNFLCKFCESSFQKIENFITHMKEFHENKLCHSEKNDQFGSENDKLHMSEVCLDEISSYQCSADIIKSSYLITTINCQSIEKNSIQIEQHKRTKNNENNEISSKESDNLEVESGKRKRLDVFCNICDKAFTTYRDLKIHKENDHKISDQINETNQIGIYKCTYCDLRFTSRPRRARHLRVHSGERPFKCKVCGKSFRVRPACENHENKHFENSDEPKESSKSEIESEKRKTLDVLCDLCDKAFATWRDLKIHRKSDHQKSDDDVNERGQIGIYKCTYCDLRFSSRPKRARHLRVHNGERPFKCKICGKSFRIRPACEIHESKHNMEFKCELCDLKCLNQKSLKSHMRRHGEKMFSCNYCEKKFFFNMEKKLHERRHTGEKPYQCIVCGQCFISSGCLGKHAKIHSDLKPFKCPNCDKSFHSKASLVDHAIVHKNERPFVCKICNATFPRRKGLKSHEKIHFDLREYVCKICSKAFNQYSGLYSHIKSHGEILTKVSNFVHPSN